MIEFLLGFMFGVLISYFAVCQEMGELKRLLKEKRDHPNFP